MDNIINKLLLRGKVQKAPTTITCKNGGRLVKVVLEVPRQNTRDAGMHNIQIQTWNDLADWCGDNLEPGDEIFVEAQLCQSQWKDPKTGEPRSAMVINASDVCRTNLSHDGDVGDIGDKPNHATFKQESDGDTAVVSRRNTG